MLSTVVASSAVALAGLLVAAPASVDALVVTPLSGSDLGHLAARHPAGVSPNHQAIARRKRTVHKNRKRCQQRPQPSNNSGGNNNGDNNNDANNSNNSNNSNNNNNNNNTPPATTSTSAGATPAVTTPAVPPVTTPPSNGSNTGKKLILAWPNGGDSSIPNSDYFTGNAAWYYTWSPYKVPDDGGLKFCPMLWGDHQIGDFQKLVTRGYSDCVLGMNEPNQDGQAKMDSDHGASLWNTYIGPLADQGYTMLGSPATTSAPDGLVWVKDFLNKVSVKPTHICVHYYDITASDFQKYVTNFYNEAGNRPILVTEYACQNFNGGAQCSMDQIWSFVKDTTAWMDQTSWIEGYAPFGFMHQIQNVNPDNILMKGDGHPTDLGWYFLHH